MTCCRLDADESFGMEGRAETLFVMPFCRLDSDEMDGIVVLSCTGVNIGRPAADEKAAVNAFWEVTARLAGAFWAVRRFSC